MEKLAARKVKVEILTGLVTNKINVAKTGSWRTRKPITHDLLAPCTNSCPTGIQIRDYIELIEKGELKEAWELLKENNPLPSITGRVCYHPCEGGCNRKEFDEAIAIHSLERFLGDYGLGLNLPKQTVSPSAPKVAIIGSGPAGLSAAYYLAKWGNKVTIFEQLPVSGGMLRVGIPDYRLPKDILDSQIEHIKKLGVEIKNNIALGPDLSVDKLLQQGYKAVFIATGAHKAQGLDIPGSDNPGVVSGVAFLKDINLGKSVKAGKKTVVIGGGNVAIDAARCALRLGSKDVVIAYRRSKDEMPATAEEIEACAAEGIKIEYLTAPNKIITEGGKLTGIECLRMKLGAPDSSGRKRPVPIAKSGFIIPADMVITAVGQSPELAFNSGDKKLKTTSQGTLSVDPKSLSTNIEGVYAGGDNVLGPATVVEAIASSKRAALAIDANLKGQPLPEESKGKLVEYKDLNTFYFEKEPRQVAAELPIKSRKSTFKEITAGLSEQALKDEVKRCFHCGSCNLCGTCSDFCPDMILTTTEETKFLANLDYCKGCGICVNECPRGAVEMVLEG